MSSGVAAPAAYTPWTDDDSDSDVARVLRPRQAAACTHRISFGVRAGQKVLTLQSVPQSAPHRVTGLHWVSQAGASIVRDPDAGKGSFRSLAMSRMPAPKAPGCWLGIGFAVALAASLKASTRCHGSG